MAGNLKTNSVTLGDSATDSQNFQLRTNVDGTATLARGAAGDLGDILTVDVGGKVSLPSTAIVNNGPAFSAYQSVSQTLPSSTFTKLIFQSVDPQFPNIGFSVGATSVDNLSRFQPNVAGYYQISGCFTVDTSFTGGTIAIYKNGVMYKQGMGDIGGGNVTGNIWTMSALVYLNGTTDYAELYGYILTGQALSATSALTYSQGFLARSA